MGKRRKGSNKMAGDMDKLKDAVSDDENNPQQIGLEDMYDEVDRWGMGQEAYALDVMKKNRKVRDKSDMEMFALSGTDSDSDAEVSQVKKKKYRSSKSLMAKASEEAKALKELNDEDFLDSDDLAEDEKDESEEKIEAWGRFKNHFYGGGTVEKKRGRDEESDELSDYDDNQEEEKEGRFLQQKQIDRLEEEDFMDAFGIDDAPEEKKETKKVVVEQSIAPDTSKLNNKQLAKLFKQQSPEFDGVVLDFKQKIEEAAKLAKILTNYCTNITAYLMFKAKGTNLQLHPVIGRLVEYKNLIDSLENMDSLVQPQVDRLLERLEGGETIQEIVKEEKRRAKKKLKKKQQSTLKLLEKERKVKFAEPTEDGGEATAAGKKRKAEAEEYNDFTWDERKALNFYEAIKRGRKDKTEDQPEEEESDNEQDDAEATTNPLVDNNDDLDIDIDEGQDVGKRSITLEMAKNRGLTVARNKKLKTPRTKNRVRYDNALKKRKGAVRAVRKELSRYGGEMSGINVRVRKGVKIS